MVMVLTTKKRQMEKEAEMIGEVRDLTQNFWVNILFYFHLLVVLKKTTTHLMVYLLFVYL